jgi:hypothetical protein
MPTTRTRETEMRTLKLIAAAILVVLGSCGAMVGSLVAFEAVDRWGYGRFWRVAEAETFLLPERFEGPVTLVFADAGGDSLPREGVARLYDFRRREVRAYREAVVTGGRSPDFYYVDAQGRRTHVARGERCDDGPAASGVYVCPPTCRSWAAVPTGRLVETWVVTRDRHRVETLQRLGDERGSAWRR